MSRTRNLWLVAIGLGVLMILAGVAWIVYYATQTGDDLNASTGAYESDSWWPIAGFFLSFIGGTLISVATLGWMFSWFSGDDDDSRHTERSAVRQVVPTTRVGWGPDPEENPPESR